MGKHSISFDPWLCSWPDSSKQGQGFPRRFWPKWCNTYREDPMLHLFCGSSEEGEIRVDAREESLGANIVGDFRVVDSPLFHGYFKSAFADPPYSEQFAAEWGFPYPKPLDILKVMQKVVQPGGHIGILHLQVCRPPKGLVKVAWHPVFSGTTKHLRCLSVFKVAE